VEGEHISIQEIAMDNDLDIEVPIQVTAETAEGGMETYNLPPGAILERGHMMESVVIGNHVMEAATSLEGGVTLVTSGMGPGSYIVTAPMGTIATETDQVVTMVHDGGNGAVVEEEAMEGVAMETEGDATMETVVLEEGVVVEDGEGVVHVTAGEGEVVEYM
jgi:hypothetical protein